VTSPIAYGDAVRQPADAEVVHAGRQAGADRPAEAAGAAGGVLYTGEVWVFEGDDSQR